MLAQIINAILFVALFCASALALGEEVQPRRDPYARMNVTELMSEINSSKGMATIGIKAAGQRRGVWKKDILIERTAFADAIDQVRGLPGVAIDSISPNPLPYVTAHISNSRALSGLRRLPFIDYIEPLYAEYHAMTSGCSGAAWSGPTDTLDGELDVIPWVFFEHSIPEAWGRSQGGRGITVGVVDTGTYTSQPQLNSNFAAGQSPSRSALHLVGPDADDEVSCDHGTRIAGILSAPRDNQNIIGVAWESDLVTMKVLDGVWINSSAKHTSVANGIWDLHGTNVKVVTMAIGSGSFSNAVEDAILSLADDVIFVAAAGTGGWIVCSGGVVFPANLSNSDGYPVIAVTGADSSGEPDSDVCYGPEVDLTARIKAPTTGKDSETHIVSLTGSSQATALVAGVAALVWSQSPTMSADAIREVLLSSGERTARDTETGFGRINAEKAVNKVFPVWVFPVIF